ncbi:MAG: HNH endonuclease family protein [Candidatus Microsaccharimonas sp.]
MRRRRAVLVLVVGTALLAAVAAVMPQLIEESSIGWSTVNTKGVPAEQGSAQEALGKLEVKGRASKTGYARTEFGNGWAKVNGCTTRDIILHRDLENVVLDTDCKVVGGQLHDPYTATTIMFNRDNANEVQIDHVVALSDAWQKGAQQLTKTQREQLANDPLELLAVDGGANQQKSDGDAATWLPKNKSFRCAYVARQIAVKVKYSLWVSEAEKNAMNDVLSGCPTQQLPVM